MNTRAKISVRTLRSAKISEIDQQVAKARVAYESARDRAKKAKAEAKRVRKLFKRAKQAAKAARKRLKALKRVLNAATLAAISPAVAKAKKKSTPVAPEIKAVRPEPPRTVKVRRPRATAPEVAPSVETAAPPVPPPPAEPAPPPAGILPEGS